MSLTGNAENSTTGNRIESMDMRSFQLQNGQSEILSNEEVINVLLGLFIKANDIAVSILLREFYES